MDVGLVAQKGNERAALLAERLRTRLREAGVDVVVDAATADAIGVEGTPVETFDATDLVVSIGGDGTFLFAARGAADTPIVGVNLGEVGFLNAVGPDEAVETVLAEVDAYREGALDVREAPRLAPSVDGWTGDPAANEVTIQGPRRGHGGGVDLTVHVDGSTYTRGHADGVLVSTPTGSTAYNLSEGGPLVHPRVPALVVTEMCAADGMPPLVVPLDSTVTVALSGAEYAAVVSDGRSVHEVDLPVEVDVAPAEPPVRIAGPSSNFFEALGKLD